MNILKSIGAFFNKLWRWIRETAWVQPLLIVGGIFAVIFSIPKITAWAESVKPEATSQYYNNYRRSLEGETNESDITSEADRITDGINRWSNYTTSNNHYDNYADYRAALEADPANPLQYGEKYFLVYVGNDCPNCDAIQPAFETLAEGWGSSYTIEDQNAFRIHTIFTDDESSNDEDYATDEDKKAFVRYLDKFSDLGFFSDAGGRFSDMTPYASRGSVSTSDYDHFIEADHTLFATPTIILVDYSEEAFNLNSSRPGASEILFGVTGADKYEKAKVLAQMWNHTTKTDTSNKFSDVYGK